jgi:DsbC/DsbD-like thiol-disulfide interchange protein
MTSRANFKTVYYIVWAMALSIALAAAVLAQDEPVKLDPVKWSLKTDLGSRPLKGGDKFDVQITAEIEDGWHLYSTEEMPQGPKPTRINLAADQPFETTGSIDSPLPQTAFDENFGTQTEFYETSATFTLPLQVMANAPAGKRKLTVQVRFQTCTEKLCLPPKLVELESEVAIKSGK